MLSHPAARDTALLLLRLVLGVIFIAHGWDKLVTQGMGKTTAFVDSLHIPQPQVAAWGSLLLELIGGAMLVVGLLTTGIAMVLAVYSAAIMYFAHVNGGFFVANNGVEFVLLIVVALFVLFVFGAGRASADRALTRFT